MAQITFIEAIWQAIREEMRMDSRVLVLGQDVQFDVDTGALQEFGPERVRNTPISETGFIGAAIGAALTGMRPIVELGCSTFLYSAMDQVVNQAAKSRYMFGGQASVPLVIRAPVLSMVSAAAHHADRPWGLFAQAPGLKIIVPTSPYDAKGLMKSAIRDGNPVLCFEDVSLIGLAGDVPGHEYTIALGTADIKQPGEDVTIVAVAAAVQKSLEAARILAGQGLSAEVIDLRCIVPLDKDTILESVTRTGRLVVVDTAPRSCGVAAEVCALVAEEAFNHLKSPIARLTAPNVPAPFSSELERRMYPGVEEIVAAVLSRCYGTSRSIHESFEVSITEPL